MKDIKPGLAVIHSNKLEVLCSLIVEWTKEYPLQALENEIILVQSNGMSQWLKIALADREALGVCAAVAPQLPARFIWSIYQAVFQDEVIPDISPFDKSSLTWRIFRLLDNILSNIHFQPLRQFLEDDADVRKKYQLALCLADLFDQYQVYRFDWLNDWAGSDDVIRDAFGKSQAIAAENLWQPELWRLLLNDVPDEYRNKSRALLHERFLDRLAKAGPQSGVLPKRIIVFGISSLPKQLLDALSALGHYCQVLLCVSNPCRYYWADIVEQKEFLQRLSRRHVKKPQTPETISDENLHFYANPLLAAWGKQGRDYINLLEEYDIPENHPQGMHRIDLFEDFHQPGSESLLKQVQQAVLDLVPLPENGDERKKIAADDSIIFQISHRPQREVEILHDHLLSLFSAEEGACGLVPREVIVMVPDIDTYAPHIEAVFGQIHPQDARHIPYSLTDQAERGRNPILVALESLLHLPESRFTSGNLMDLLDVQALRQRFGIKEGDLGLLRQWIHDSGIRWGLHAKQRLTIGLPSEFEQNTWQFGLRRMLLGYAVGSGGAWQGIEPYDEVGGLDAALVGPLTKVLEALEKHWAILNTPANYQAWLPRLRTLMDDFFLPSGDRDQLAMERLEESLERWEAICEEVGLIEELPLTVVREAWLANVDEPTLTQKFLAGRVNFCTLLPMRAIPFQVVCLMGMNEGDYPRSHVPVSFDLMADPGLYRPGDRSRREDDRYLFLEALLSARRQLYISWMGRSVKDNSERPPSLLVDQLRDYLSKGWALETAAAPLDAGQALLEQLTVVHPLQAFSPRYFSPPQAEGNDPRLFSYAHEWRSAHDLPVIPTDSDLQPFEPKAPLGLDVLGFFLRYPVRAFFNYRLKVWFDGEAISQEDEEPFSLDRLQEHTLGAELLDSALKAGQDQAQSYFLESLARQERRGDLPLGGFARLAKDKFAGQAWNAFLEFQALSERWPLVDDAAREVSFAFTRGPVPVLLEDWVHGLRHDGQGRWAQIQVNAQPAMDGKGVPKWHRMTRLWVRHLATCAGGWPTTSYFVGSDGIVALPAVPARQAMAWLEDLIQAWHYGMSQPLPVACKSAFAFLSCDGEAETALTTAATIYQGGPNRVGELEQDAYLARAFPRFEQMLAPALGFDYWCGQLYLPLCQTWQGTDA